MNNDNNHENNNKHGLKKKTYIIRIILIYDIPNIQGMQFEHLRTSITSIHHIHPSPLVLGVELELLAYHAICHLP